MKRLLLVILCSTILLCLVSCNKTSTKINGWGKEELIEELSKKNYSISLQEDSNDARHTKTFSYDKDNDKFIVTYEANNDNKTDVIAKTSLYASVVWSWGSFEKGKMIVKTSLSFLEESESDGFEREYKITKYHRVDSFLFFDVDSYETTKSVGDTDSIVNFYFANTLAMLGDALNYANEKIQAMTDNNLTIR